MTLQQAKQALEQGLRVTHKNGQYLIGDGWYLVLAANRATIDGYGETKPIDKWITTHEGVPFDWNEDWSIVPKEDNIVLTEDDLDYNLKDYLMGPEVTNLG